MHHLQLFVFSSDINIRFDFCGEGPEDCFAF